jgi:DNA-binding LacI/PurR family transcriptional regulator
VAGRPTEVAVILAEPAAGAVTVAVDPPLTVLSQDPEDMGRLAAQRLFTRLDGDDSPPVHHIIPTTLLVRGSGEIAYAANPGNPTLEATP